MNFIEILATIFASLIILKIVIFIIAPKQLWGKVIKIYDDKNIINFLYYFYLVVGSILIYFIHKQNISWSQILAIFISGYFIIGGAMIRMFGQNFSDIFKERSIYTILKSIWLYLLIVITLCILSLSEIYCCS